MNHKSNISNLLPPKGRVQKTLALGVGLSALGLVAVMALAAMSFGAPAAKAASPAIQDEYSFLVDDPEMIVVPHYAAGSDAAFLVANPEMMLVPHDAAGSETAFLAANPEMMLVPHYAIGSETASLVANPELIVARSYGA